MRTEYEIVDTSTLAGLEKAERMHATGWKTYRTGLHLIWMYRKTKKA